MHKQAARVGELAKAAGEGLGGGQQQGRGQGKGRERIRNKGMALVGSARGTAVGPPHRSSCTGGGDPLPLPPVSSGLDAQGSCRAGRGPQ